MCARSLANRVLCACDNRQFIVYRSVVRALNRPTDLFAGVKYALQEIKPSVEYIKMKRKFPRGHFSLIHQPSALISIAKERRKKTFHGNGPIWFAFFTQTLLLKLHNDDFFPANFPRYEFTRLAFFRLRMRAQNCSKRGETGVEKGRIEKNENWWNNSIIEFGDRLFMELSRTMKGEKGWRDDNFLWKIFYKTFACFHAYNDA